MMRALLLLSLATVPLGRGSRLECWNDFAGLAELLPRYGVPTIDEARQLIIQTDIREAMRSVRSQGLAPERAIELALQQATADDESFESALQTAEQAGSASSRALRDQIARGVRVTTECESINGKAKCMAVVLRYSAIANRAMAAEFACHVQAGTFPSTRDVSPPDGSRAGYAG